jgi:hypothetical protein
MFTHLYALKRLALALTATTLASLLVIPTAAAQTTTQLLVRVESPAAGQTHAGTITFTGLAVDGATNQPATRVAVYDAEVRDANYLADVSMETMRPLADAFPGRPGTARIGWRLMLDSNRLVDGRHTLHFVGHFANNATADTTFDLAISNRPTTYVPNQYGYPVNNGDMAWTPQYPAGMTYYNGYYYNGAYYRAPYAGYYPYQTYPYQTYPYQTYPYQTYPYQTYPTTYPTGYNNGYYYYNGRYYPAGYTNQSGGWYYQNGIWVWRPY